MEPKTLTTLGELKTGDRFCYATDKGKVVYTVVPCAKPKTWQVKGKTYFADIEVKDDAGKSKWSKRSTNVVFLRHTINENETAVI